MEKKRKFLSILFTRSSRLPILSLSPATPSHPVKSIREGFAFKLLLLFKMLYKRSYPTEGHILNPRKVGSLSRARQSYSS